MKIWHDDIRVPPDDSWTWCRTNERAMVYLRQASMGGEPVTDMSMDHDLGLHDLDPADYDQPDLLKGWSAETGADLASWMCGGHMLPTESLTIHSWNEEGAAEMAAMFREIGVDVIVEPFQR